MNREEITALFDRREARGTRTTRPRSPRTTHSMPSSSAQPAACSKAATKLSGSINLVHRVSRSALQRNETCSSTATVSC